MRKRKHISLFLLSLLAMITHSCHDDNFYIAEGTEMKFTINATPQIPGEESRAVLSTEVNITRYCFLYFDGKSSDAQLLYSRDIAPSEMPFYTMLPGPGTNNTYAALLLANVTLSDLGNPAVGSFTLGDLVNKTITIDNLYNKPTSNTDFTWSGYLDVTTASNSLNFVVNPNMAKLTMTFTNVIAEAEVVNARMRNIPNKVGLAQNALNQAGITTAISDIAYIDYDLEDISVTKDNPHSDAWYMPQNMQGTVTDGRLSTSANKPPTNATYLEFDVLSSTFSTPLATSYKIYPGINPNKVGYGALDDFNVKSGIIYEMTAQITTDGITGSVGNGFAADDKNAVAKVKLPTGSNCYMIHPICDRITTGNGTIYELPIDRVNEYWQGVRNQQGEENGISENTKWEVVVIWQDIPKRTIYFCDEYGNGSLDKYSGVGENPFYFRLVNNSTDPSQQNYGNIVVGIKIPGSSSFLWSWHLWVTDYNPDGAPTHELAENSLKNNDANMMYAQNGNGYSVDLQGGKYCSSSSDTLSSEATYGYSYGDSGNKWGNVQHFNSLRSTYWTSVSTAIWDGTGIYSKKWMMDRALGSQLPNNCDAEYPLDAWGLYYQYGRKDPFSYDYTYNIDGSQRTAYTSRGEQWEIASSGSLDKGVQFPNTFYTASSAKWASDADENDWFSPDNDPMNPTNKGDKTIFDPCPPGWRLPIADAFHFAQLSNATAGLKERDDYTSATAAYNAYTGAHASFEIYANAHGTRSSTATTAATNTSLFDPYRHFGMITSTGPYLNGDYRDLDACFPMQGYITGEYGTMSGILSNNGTLTGSAYNMRGCLWTVEYTGGSNYAAKLIQMNPSTVNAAGTDLSKTADVYRLRRFYRIYYAKLEVFSWVNSRGQNVRCIQE